MIDFDPLNDGTGVANFSDRLDEHMATRKAAFMYKKYIETRRHPTHYYVRPPNGIVSEKSFKNIRQLAYNVTELDPGKSVYEKLAWTRPEHLAAKTFLMVYKVAK